MKFNVNCLDDFFSVNNIVVTEGNCNNLQKQYDELINICKTINPKFIMEIGFNGGHSAELFLENSNAYLYSFDIGNHFHSYLKFGKMYINNKFPDRHTLVIGDSTERVPIFSSNHPEIKFDIIFIDGGHEYKTAISDLINCKKMAHDNTIVIMDDIIKDSQFSANHTIGPTKAWNQCINNKIVKETSYFLFEKGRGMCVGKYLF
jgi:predicted O-methyltransferase YrrM